MLRLLRLISYPQLRAGWGRSLLVIGGIATGVALIVAIDVINASVLAGFRRTIERVAGPAQLQVTLGIGELGFSEAAADLIRTDPAVVAAIPLTRGTVGLVGDPGTTLQLFGVDLTAEEDLQRYTVTSGDRREILANMNDPSSILVTSTFAEPRGLDVGRSLTLATPTGTRPYTIRGILEARGMAAAFGGLLIVMDLPAAQRALAKDGQIDQIDVVLADGSPIDAVQARLQSRLPTGLRVLRPAERGAEYDGVLGSFQAMLTGLSLLCLVAGIYIVYNTTSTAAVHRALTMAALRLQGAERSQLFRLLMLEALVLGVLGVVAGIPIGVLLAMLLTGMVSDSMSVIFQIRFPVEALTMRLQHQPWIFVVGIGATLFASYASARRVARMEPLAIMRADFRAVTRSPSARRLIVGWIALVAISTAALAIEVQQRSILWGNFGSTLWFAASIVIAIPLVRASRAIFSQILPRLFGAAGRVAAKSLYRSPVRTGVTAAAIALVMTVALTSSSLSWSLSRNISSYFSGGFLACDLAVSAVTTDGGWLETPIPDELGGEIGRLEGVRSIDLIRIFPGQMFRGERIAVGGGSDGIFDPDRYPRGWYRSGNPETAAVALRAGTGANVSLSLAERFRLAVGDRITLDAPDGPLSLAITGIVPDYMSDRGSVILNRRLLVEHWNDHAVNRIHVFLRPGAAAEDVRTRIAARLGKDYALKILMPGEVVAFHAEQVARAFVLMDAVQLLIVVVTVAGILDLLLSSIVERKRELSLWRMIGADEGAVRRSVVVESGTIGAMGGILGIALGFVTSAIWVGMNFRYLLGYYLQFYFAWTSAFRFLVLVAAMAMTAGYLAAVAATRQSTLDGLRID